MGRTTEDAGQVVGQELGKSVGWAGRALRIGDWDADGATNVVRRGDQAVHLEPKAMEVLCFLAGRPGAVVTRDELLAALWPGLVVGDDTLTQAVIKLRRALGDDPRSPRYIETVPKRGYRLIAAVGSPEESSGSLPAMPATATPGGSWLLPVVAVAGAGSMLAVGLWLHRGPDSSIAVGEGVAPRAASAPVTTRDTSRTLVVMPFHVLGDHPGRRDLAEGLASELAADLSRMLGVTVVRADAASSGTAELADAVGGAAFVVLGAVQRMEDRIAVEARLEDAATGHEIWSERYYRPFGDLFEIRDDIEARIASRLSARISEAPERRDFAPYSRSVDAYDAFLRARTALLGHTEADHETAERFYRRAIKLDSAFARAYSGLAVIHAADYRHQWVDDRKAALRRAVEMAEAAVQIDPKIPEAHWVLGYVSAQHRRHDEALAHLDKALAVAPGFADAIALKGGINTYIGEPAASVSLLRTAMELKPSPGYLYYLALGRAYFFLGDFQQADVNLRAALAGNPASLEAHLYLAAALWNSGDVEGAAWEAEEVRSLRPGFSCRAWIETYPMTDTRQIEALVSALDSVNL